MRRTAVLDLRAIRTEFSRWLSAGLDHRLRPRYVQHNNRELFLQVKRKVIYKHRLKCLGALGTARAIASLRGLEFCAEPKDEIDPKATGIWIRGIIRELGRSGRPELAVVVPFGLDWQILAGVAQH